MNCLECGGVCCDFVIIERALDADNARLMELRNWKQVEPGVWLVKAPCAWAKEGRCTHYNSRPQICRDFQEGGIDCERVRRLISKGFGEAYLKEAHRSSVVRRLRELGHL